MKPEIAFLSWPSKIENKGDKRGQSNGHNWLFDHGDAHVGLRIRLGINEARDMIAYFRKKGFRKEKDELVKGNRHVYCKPYKVNGKVAGTEFAINYKWKTSDSDVTESLAHELTHHDHKGLTRFAQALHNKCMKTTEVHDRIHMLRTIIRALNKHNPRFNDANHLMQKNSDMIAGVQVVNSQNRKLVRDKLKDQLAKAEEELAVMQDEIKEIESFVERIRDVEELREQVESYTGPIKRTKGQVKRYKEHDTPEYRALVDFCEQSTFAGGYVVEKEQIHNVLTNLFQLEIPHLLTKDEHFSKYRQALISKVQDFHDQLTQPDKNRIAQDVQDVSKDLKSGSPNQYVIYRHVLDHLTIADRASYIANEAFGLIMQNQGLSVTKALEKSPLLLAYIQRVPGLLDVIREEMKTPNPAFLQSTIEAKLSEYAEPRFHYNLAKEGLTMLSRIKKAGVDHEGRINDQELILFITRIMNNATAIKNHTVSLESLEDLRVDIHDFLSSLQPTAEDILTSEQERIVTESAEMFPMWFGDLDGYALDPEEFGDLLAGVQRLRELSAANLQKHRTVYLPAGKKGYDPVEMLKHAADLQFNTMHPAVVVSHMLSAGATDFVSAEKLADATHKKRHDKSTRAQATADHGRTVGDQKRAKPSILLRIVRALTPSPQTSRRILPLTELDAAEAVQETLLSRFEKENKPIAHTNGAVDKTTARTVHVADGGEGELYRNPLFLKQKERTATQEHAKVLGESDKGNRPTNKT